MSIVRRQRSTWTTVDNRIINDRRLSMKALGLLVFMLSKPDNWVFSQESLGEWFDEGRDAMRSVMKNLSEAGYIQREVVRMPNGQLRTTTIVCEEPDTGFPAPAEPSSADPPGGSPVTLVMTDSEKTEPAKTEKKTQGAELEPELFERMWVVYPRREGRSRASTVKAWNARIKSGTKAEVMLAGAERYAKYCEARKVEQQYMKQPETFFGPNAHFLNDWTPHGTSRPSVGSTAGMNYKEGYGPNGEIL